jgi:enediyne polyketide synthase
VVGKPVEVIRRFDGKPEVIGESNVSVAHSGEITLAVASRGLVGCDIEQVQARPIPTWQDLLGTEPFRLAETIAQQSGSDLDASATRVWTALESLKKAGANMNAPLVLASTEEDGWVRLRSGPLVIASFVASVRSTQGRVAIGVLTSCERAFRASS